MTAVVGILNKQAVALAADSAVTIGGTNGRKIFNKANKVFALSKQHPVGVMIYNAASFMTTPWETIIKVYRKQLDNKSFPTIKEYEHDFIAFLRSKNFYTNAEMQTIFLESFALDIINSVVNEIVKQNRGLIDNPTPESRLKFLEILETNIDNLLTYWNAYTEFCNEFANYTFEMFTVYSSQVFERINQHHFANNGIILPLALMLKIKQTVYTILRAKEELSSFTGLIFCGFGEDEIYPQLIPVNISMVVDNRLRYYINKTGQLLFRTIIMHLFVLLHKQM